MKPNPNIVHKLTADQIINSCFNGLTSEQEATQALELLRIRGNFDLDLTKYIGYDYNKQQWIELGVS